MTKKNKKIKTFPYLPTLKLKNKLETDLFFSWPVGIAECIALHGGIMISAS